MSADRTRELAAIHSLKRQLGLDDPTYRDALHRLTGQRSAGDLDDAGRRKVIDYFVQARKGEPARPDATKGKPNNVGNSPQLQKVEALLADHGLKWAYADAILKRQTGGKVERCQFANEKQLQGVIAALTVNAKRKERRDI